jgi:arylsulfatase
MVKKNVIFPVLLSGTTVALLASSGKLENNRPNIVLILADDMGYSDIGCFGSEIKTLNLDRLAQQGLRMTQFYNASRSCPTRASMLTGLYQHQAGVGDMVSDQGYPSYQGFLNDKCVTLAELLKMNGYRTFMSGKWHVGGKPEALPLNRGFERYFGLIDGAGSYYKPIAYRANMKPVRWMLDDNDFFPPDTGFYFTDAIGDYALSFIKEREKNEPFFLYLAFTAPHWPLHALPEDIQKYRGKYMMGWDKLREERYNRMLSMGIIDQSVKLSQRDSKVPQWDTLTEEAKEMWDLRMAVYAAMIDRLDQNIGRVITCLEKAGELDNTLIIFLADNGGCHESTRSQAQFLKVKGKTGTPDSFDAYELPWANASNTPFRMFKHWVHEGGIATPFIAYYPKLIKGGRIDSQTAHIIDIMPTVVEMTGARYPGKIVELTETEKPEIIAEKDIIPMEGVSLLPVFQAKKLKRKSPLFWEHEGNRAVRYGDWKLVSVYDNSAAKSFEWELYNMKEDRSELNNLSGKYPRKKSEMIEMYQKWATRTGVVPREQIDRR